jgi:TRAP-type mannitol/chloroaromatic compound transport system permease large subunit
MLIVYAAVAGQSIVKLYAAAMLPGFFLSFLYLLYILGWAVINPKIAPSLPPDQYRVQVPQWLQRLERGPARRVAGGLLAALVHPALVRSQTESGGAGIHYGLLLKNVLVLMVPMTLALATFGAAWWYVIIYNAPSTAAPAAIAEPLGGGNLAPESPAPATDERPQELGAAPSEPAAPEELSAVEAPPQEMSLSTERAAAAETGKVPAHFYQWFWGLAVFAAVLLALYYWRLDGEHFEILKELVASVVPLGVLTVVVLAVILFGICTATESAAVGALGALYLAVMSKYPREVWWWSLGGATIGLVLGWAHADFVELLVSASLGAAFAGTLGPGLLHIRTSAELRQNIKEATFLTAKTTAMVCWLFIGSALFSAVFALHGGQGLIERWVLGMQLSPIGFLIMSQLIIFLLGWPLEWTEIIVIFCPIFIPLLGHFQVDPILFGTMVAVNLQAAFLSPPVAMSAFYLKGVSPPHVTLNQIFAGMMPYMLIVVLCLVCMYVWPGMTLWLPQFLYGS